MDWPGLAMSKFRESGRAVRSNYDRLSPWYDLLAAGSERKARAAGLDLLKVREGDIVLEIGFGTGQSLLSLARSIGDSGRVIGIDLSRGMISQAKTKLRKAGLTQRAALACGDALHLPLRPESCDAIFMSFALELFEPGEMETVLSESRRALRNGGLLCVVALAEKAGPGLLVRMYGWAHRKFPHIIDCRPFDVHDFVTRAGFQIRDTLEMAMWGLPIGIVLAEKV